MRFARDHWRRAGGAAEQESYLRLDLRSTILSVGLFYFSHCKNMFGRITNRREMAENKPQCHAHGHRLANKLILGIYFTPSLFTTATNSIQEHKKTFLVAIRAIGL